MSETQGACPDDAAWFERLAVSEAGALARGEAAILPVGGSEGEPGTYGLQRLN
jgi:hypothetical protein